MSGPPQVRRVDKLMPEERARQMLAGGFCGRLATVGADGWPYAVPLLYVWLEGEVWLHGARGPGHLRRNVDHEPRVCFEVDEVGDVFPYGRFECDTSIAYRSVVAFGRIRVVEDPSSKTRFFTELMRKYGDAAWERPPEFFPRLGDITLYALTIERLTGKETPLPEVSRRWPALDSTKTPGAVPP